MTEIITFSISNGLRTEIDVARGDISRSRFIARSLESYLNERYQATRRKTNSLQDIRKVSKIRETLTDKGLDT